MDNIDIKQHARAPSLLNCHHKPNTEKAPDSQRLHGTCLQMVLRAMYHSDDLKEKQNVHDISVVHREYQESGKIGGPRSILGREIRALEQIT
ncbi:hypothetical protein GcC1_072025 [Golovinomyces cichoracearum]|uniref:Uncharacterized protein n=1 Tax=Golovinomyces cichoracearum TaxID=62708 RepID=A0A420IPE8_9PEZI|nr:hypothetical protein GcC1_072025 [Golovinomyces cichoracearum]